MGSNTFRILGVPEILRGEVKCILAHKFSGTMGTTINVFPSGIPGIVFHHNEGRAAIENIVTQSGHTFSPPILFLHGAGTESSIMKFAKGSYTVIQVILKPHAVRKLFGINALRLNEGEVELNEFSRVDLTEELLDACNDQQRVAVLTDFLAARLKRLKTQDTLVEESLCLINQWAGRITVKAVLEHLDISERQFERRFSETVGLSPLSYIRVRRFNEAMRLIKSGRYNTLTDVAYALNFHDQSHFIREVKAFTGVTPKSLSQRADDFIHNQAGYSYM
jgi:AraC-like DNA-binding protein